MKQIVISRHGGIDVLQMQEKDDPQPSTKEVVIDVKASGVNFADILARKGLYPDAPKPPCVVGYEVAGIIHQTGEDVVNFKKGDRVLALTRFKGYADKVCVPMTQVFSIPNSLSFPKAAALPVNYLTAYQLLFVMGALSADESVLIHNAGGGVGLAALDIALHIGATPYGTASSAKHNFLKERGLHQAIDYRTKDFEKELMELTDGRGVELIIDPIGGKNWKKNYRCLRSTGRLGMFGVSTVSGNKKGKILPFLKLLSQIPLYNPIPLMNGNKGVFGVNVGHLWHEGAKIKIWMENILKGVEEGWIRPYVDQTFPLAEAGRAHAYIEDRRNTGKVVLESE
ncbi:MAG: zinc-binding dehydrogenase [Caldithrix sp.]|nr:zinc-binding dehydrogenase [Caldithrix sp.]